MEDEAAFALRIRANLTEAGFVTDHAADGNKGWILGDTEAYDAAILETHHKLKKDAPSGTALRLAQAVAEGRRSDNTVPTASIRVGGVVGDHSLVLAGPFERLTLSHCAQSRDAFALGALEAALWTARKRPGLYDMLDLMGLR